MAIMLQILKVQLILNISFICECIWNWSFHRWSLKAEFAVVCTYTINDDNFLLFSFYSKPNIVLNSVCVTFHGLLTILCNKEFLSIFRWSSWDSERLYKLSKITLQDDRTRTSIQVQFRSVQSLSCVWLFATPWTAARQASLSITHSGSLSKLMSI